MIAAPVGFHCPACVAQARQRTPPVRTTLGGVAAAHPRRATTTLIGLNLVLYVLTLISGDRLIVEYGMFPVAVAAGEWWRLATAPFLHAGLWHVGLNMFALWVLGGLVEPLLGRGRFVAVYGVSAFAGAVASYVFSSPVTLSVGASGAVFGLLGATFVALRTLNRDVSGIVVLLLINLVIGFVLPNIDWRAHLGGLLAGAAITAAFVAPARRYRAVVGWSAVVVALAALAALTLWRTEQLLALVA
jgi:membrane associated rhomboid family serine protease